MRTKFTATVVAAAAFCLLSTGANAQSANSVTLEAGYAEAFEVQGAEVGIGYRLNAGAFHFTPTIGGFIYQSDNDRYYFDGNVNRCRDRTNGQFVRDIQCNDAAVDAFGRLEATASFRNVEAGVGYRLAEEESVVYGTVSVKLGEMWAVKANAGQDYVGLGLVLRR